VTLIIAGAAGAALATLVESLLRRIRTSRKITLASLRKFQGIRRHTRRGGVWENTISSSVTANGRSVFLDEQDQDTVYIGRHHRDPRPIDINATEIIDDTPSSGRHSIDNPYRRTVSQEIQEIHWQDGTRSVRPVWMPVIGNLRIALIATNTAEYAIARRPIASTPFTGITRPAITGSNSGGRLYGRIPDSYYVFTTT
jgi:hypothetical protein